MVNTIEIDCKLDMEIPKENLQNNLQLLIDRHGVQEVSNLIEQLTDTNNTVLPRKAVFNLINENS